jgi:uncharacterized protein YycO
MKKLLLPAFCVLIASGIHAQSVANQNPNFEISRTRYMNMRDSLTSTQSTTVQNTYKAYDWMALKQERKDIRFQNRQQRRLNRSMNDFNYGYPYGNYGQPYLNNNFYYNGYNNNGYYRNRYGSGNYYNRSRPSFWWWLF